MVFLIVVYVIIGSQCHKLKELSRQKELKQRLAQGLEMKIIFLSL